MSDRAYYRNSLNAWRDELLKQRRVTEVRLKHMRQTRHPDANDQEILLAHNAEMVEVCERALRVADALQRAQDFATNQVEAEG